MNHCVIHPECVEYAIRFIKPEERNINLFLETLNRAMLAQITIDGLLATRENIHIHNVDSNLNAEETIKDLIKIAGLYSPGDEVTLYGAFKGGCLKTVEAALQEKGIKVQYHPLGCI